MRFGCAAWSALSMLHAVAATDGPHGARLASGPVLGFRGEKGLAVSPCSLTLSTGLLAMADADVVAVFALLLLALLVLSLALVVLDEAGRRGRRRRGRRQRAD